MFQTLRIGVLDVMRDTKSRQHWRLLVLSVCLVLALVIRTCLKLPGSGCLLK